MKYRIANAKIFRAQECIFFSVRLCQHLQDYRADKEKFYWHTAITFTGHDLNKALKGINTIP